MVLECKTTRPPRSAQRNFINQSQHVDYFSGGSEIKQNSFFEVTGV
jgi:hypothetical protein